MYAQVRKYDSMRDGRTVEQVCKDIERTGASSFEQVPGFVAYVAVELEDGGLLTVSVYEDEAGVDAAKEVSAQWNRVESGGALPERPDKTFEGQVRIHHAAMRKEVIAQA